MTTHCERCNRELSTFRAINGTTICSRCEEDEEPYPSRYQDDGGEVIHLDFTERQLEESLDALTPDVAKALWPDEPFSDQFYDSLVGPEEPTIKDTATS